MMRIRLSEEDAERLGCPRNLEFDFERVMGRELMALEEQVGWDYSTFGTKMQGIPLTDHAGAPVWETDDDGKLVTDPKTGKPIQMRGLKVEQLLVMVWLCVLRANPQCRWDTFDVNLAATDFVEDSAGKAEADSEPSTSGTKRRSPKGSGSGRGSKKKS